MRLLIILVSHRSQQASGLGLIIFFAILLHKAPAALGFGTFLQHEGASKWEIICHLGVNMMSFILNRLSRWLLLYQLWSATLSFYSRRKVLNLRAHWCFGLGSFFSFQQVHSSMWLPFTFFQRSIVTLRFIDLIITLIFQRIMSMILSISANQ